MLGLSHPTDISLAQDPGALRAVARAQARCYPRPSLVGCELILLHGGANALQLNLLLNLNALGYSHSMLYVFEEPACAKLATMVSRLPGPIARRAELLSTPCIHDSQFADDPALRRWIGFTTRWLPMARLVRLGYSTLTIDADMAVLDDALAYLHSPTLCGRFALMFASENPNGGLQNGLAYACGALRDGGAAHVLQETVDRYLRFADSCGGPLGTDATGTVCPAGSWLSMVRMLWHVNWDQIVTGSAVHGASSGEGWHWWMTLAQIFLTGLPGAAQPAAIITAKKRVEALQRTVPRSIMGLAFAAEPPAAKRGEALATTANGTWLRSPFAPPPWWRRFSLVAPADRTASTNGAASSTDAFNTIVWTVARPAVSLARRLPAAVGQALDVAWQQTCVEVGGSGEATAAGRSGRRFKSRSARRLAVECDRVLETLDAHARSKANATMSPATMATATRPAAATSMIPPATRIPTAASTTTQANTPAMTTRMSAKQRWLVAGGLLPSKRGALSRAFQRVLDEDLSEPEPMDLHHHTSPFTPHPHPPHEGLSQSQQIPQPIPQQLPYVQPLQHSATTTTSSAAEVEGQTNPHRTHRSTHTRDGDGGAWWATAPQGARGRDGIRVLELG